MSKPKSVLISLHDVTPFHLERLQKAETCFRHWGISAVSYLLIPDYRHINGQYDPDRLKRFREWLVRPRPFHLEWLLHGYYHWDFSAEGAGVDGAPASETTGEKLSAADQLKRKWLTAGEGEFLPLSSSETEERLKEGIKRFRAELGFDPRGFVAPAWLYNRHLLPALTRLGFWFTEDHRNIYFLREPEGEVLSAPAITWATRTPLRKRISIFGCPLLLRWWSHKSCIRLAMHPFDFDHPETVRSIERVLLQVLKDRRATVYNLLKKS